ncbi:MAG: hypothetical protein ACRDH9_05400, partial [Actinomycetota bacterium]
MRARRLTVSLTVLVSLVPASQAFAGNNPARGSSQTEERTATRADVLAGRADQEERLNLLRASIEAAGGVVVEESEDPTAFEGYALGGYAYPLIVSDLDGDGDDEVLLEQDANRNYVVAIDDGDLAWREQLPPKSYLVGALSGDLFAEDGTEVILVLYRWNTDKTVLGGVDENGLRWTAPLDVDYSELNGLVEADTDEQAEIAITVWSDSGSITVRTLDGETGTLLSEIRSTTDQLDIGVAEQAFVTDGPEGQSDEAVFLTSLLGGYYAERLSLADGSRRTMNVFPGEEIPVIYQGVDYTGDGRRDGYISDFIYNEDETVTSTFGVFDAAALSTAWTQESEGDFPYFFIYPPYQAGDANGDGGQDLCIQNRSFGFGEPRTSTAEVRCLAGATGAELWTISREVTGEYSYASVQVESDLDANGVIDPVITTEAYTCSDDDYYCETTAFEATALNGTNGAPIWSTTDPGDSAGIWGLTGSNLDGVAGDDSFGYVYDETEPPGAPFAVYTGLSRLKAWDGFIDTGNASGYVDSAIGADLDGDGTLEAVLTSDAYEPIGEPVCEVYEGEE